MPTAKDGMRFKDQFMGIADPPPAVSGQPDAGNESVDQAAIEQWEKATGRKWHEESQRQFELRASANLRGDDGPVPRDLILTHRAMSAVAPVNSVLLAPAAEDIDDSCGYPDGSIVTLAQHLQLGKECCERRQRSANARLQKLADKRAYHWSCLMEAALAVCGEELMLKCVMPQPDLSFTFDTERITLWFRPFNRSTFNLVMACTLRKMENEVRDYEAPWSLVRGTGYKPFCVQQDWRPTADELKAFAETRTYTVNEAVYLTFMQSGNYDDALKRQLQMRLRDRKESAG